MNKGVLSTNYEEQISKDLDGVDPKLNKGHCIGTENSMEISAHKTPVGLSQLLMTQNACLLACLPACLPFLP